DVAEEDIFFLAQRGNIPLPVKTDGELKNYFRRLREKDLKALFQKGFGLVTSVMQTEENLEYVAFHEVEHLAQDGIIYAELRFAPQYHTGESTYYGHAQSDLRQKLNYQTIIRAVSRGLKLGEKEFGVKTKIIVCIGREAEPDVGVKIAQAAIDCAPDGVVALDLACDEASYPPERHLLAFELTFNSPLKRTVHAGEFGGRLYENIKTAIFKLRADRLGHAIPISQHEDLLKAVVEKKIGLELCPLSNTTCGFIKSHRDLNINSLIDRGALVSINTDDPGIFNFTLSDVLVEVLKDSAEPRRDLRQFQINAVNSSFLNQDEKDKLLDMLNQAG
ncbi:MAG: adenosine deaminase, partial [Patescibacteria group bacterium]